MNGGWLTDVRHSLRSLARTPAFTVVAVLSLALGIGANTAIFSFVNAALLRSLAVDRPQELVSLYHRYEKSPGSFTATSFPEYEFYRDQSSTLTGMLAYLRVPMILGAGEDAQNISGELASGNYFEALGLHAVLGRFFAPQDREAVTVISEQLWRSQFGGDAGILGRSIRIGNGTFTVIGVAPKQFRGIVMDWAEPPSVWIPVDRYAQAVPALSSFDIVHAWGMESYPVTARLRPGRTLQQAESELATLSARVRERQSRGDRVPTLLPVQQARFWPSYRGSILTFLGALLTLVGVILLIACANLANLLLARTLNRKREIAMRLALGASRWRIARHLLSESLLIAAAGGAASIVVALWSASALEQFRRPFQIRLAIDTSWDIRVTFFSLAIVILAGVFVGVAPVLQAWREDLNPALKSASGAVVFRRARLKNMLVIGQVALSTVLLAGAGLFVRTLRNAEAQDPTLRPASVLLVNLQPSLLGYSTERGARLYDQVLASVRALPGVTGSALVHIVPFSGRRGGTNITGPDQTSRQVDFNIVSPDYFRTVGLPLLRGRDFSSGDGRGAPRAAVVNELLASSLWPGRDPIGQQFRFSKTPGEAVTAVGIVRDGKFRSYRDTPRPGIYVPAAQEYVGEMSLEVRTQGDAGLEIVAVRGAVHAIAPEMPLAEIQTMQAHLDDALSQERMMATLATGLSVLAVALAVIGIYGVFSFSVAQRSSEIGVRMALGARRVDVAAMVLRESALLAAIGIGLGGAGAVILARLAKALLYGVQAADPIALGATIAILAVTSALAALIPARRAASIDPARALRSE